MKVKGFVCLFMVAVVVALAVPAAAQDDNRPKNRAIVSVPAPDRPSGWGPFDQELWVDAFAFHGKDNGVQTDLTYVSHYYATNPNLLPIQERFFARLPLESGAVVTRVDCFVNDPSVINNVSVGLQRSTHHTSGNTFTTTTVASGASTGISGLQMFTFNANESVLYSDGVNNNLYFLTADMSNDTSIRSCRVVWHRGISAAPLTQTFGDVPISHPFHRFIEALSNSGITGGCGGGLYCPDRSLTRGVMAVFLAAALGLHFPQ